MTRIGFGYDSHRFAPGRPLVLGGVHIDHPEGLAGHSDADAACHAVIDALLGAAALGDIGEHFPPSDGQWKDADSAGLLAVCLQRVGQAGWQVGNCDLTVIAERPRLGAYKPAMRRRLAELLGVDPSAVSVKAKTNEQMGFIGRGEGLAALAAVTLEPTKTP